MEDKSKSTTLRLVRKHLLWALRVAYYAVLIANGVINYLAPPVSQPLRA